MRPQDDPAAADRLRAYNRGLRFGTNQHDGAVGRREDKPSVPRTLPVRDREDGVRREGVATRDRVRHPQHPRYQSGSVHSRHGVRGHRQEADIQVEGAVFEVRRLGGDGTVERGPHLHG